MTLFYVRVQCYDEPSDIEEYGTQDEAHEAYCTTLEAQRDGALGDVATISMGKFDGKAMKRIACKEF